MPGLDHSSLAFRIRKKRRKEERKTLSVSPSEQKRALASFTAGTFLLLLLRFLVLLLLLRFLVLLLLPLYFSEFWR